MEEIKFLRQISRIFNVSCTSQSNLKGSVCTVKRDISVLIYFYFVPNL